MTEIINPLLLSSAAVMFCVGIHFEGLLLTTWVVKQIAYRRLRVAVSLLMAIMLHFSEVTMFAVGWWMLNWCGQKVVDLAEPTFADLLYFSLTTYTSLGYGDIVPLGFGRLLAGIEALTGLVLIAWTASFTFYEMQRYWDPTSQRRARA